MQFMPKAYDYGKPVFGINLLIFNRIFQNIQEDVVLN